MTYEERILSRLKRKPMTTDQLAKDMKAARTTVVDTLTKLWRKRIVCVVSYKITGSTPARTWGLGSVDMPKPPTKTKEQISAERRAKAQQLKEEAKRIEQPQEFIPRRDEAAAWIKPIKVKAKPKPKAEPIKVVPVKEKPTPKRDIAASWF